MGNGAPKPSGDYSLPISSVCAGKVHIVDRAKTACSSQVDVEVQSDGPSTYFNVVSQYMATSQASPPMADEVETLKRELEALKLQLEQERKKNAAVQGGTDSSEQPEGPPPRGESAEPKRRGGDAKASTAPRSYVQHAAVGARQGKWWLRDRQVLSRATPEDGRVAPTLKVRETWVWSGRTVILDKIVRVEEEDDQKRGAEEEQVVEIDPEGADLTSGVFVEDDAATGSREPQQSEAVETSGEAATVNKEPAKEEVHVDAPPKADDEVRESSAPELPTA